MSISLRHQPIREIENCPFVCLRVKRAELREGNREKKPINVPVVTADDLREDVIAQFWQLARWH